MGVVNEVMELLEQRRISRRALIRTLGGAAAFGVAGSALTACGSSGSSGSSGITDFDILNFALNLEYLEAEYYLRATTGAGLSAADRGTGAGVITSKANPMVPFATPAFQQYANEIAGDELAHVKLLRGALGANAVSSPAIDLQASFNAAAVAAGIGASFDPFASETNFILGAFIFEDVGVTAYKGAARLISNKDILETAAGLLGVEAYHAGEIRTLIYSLGASVQGVAQKISDLRNAADGPIDDDQGVVVGGVSNIVPTDANGLVYSRTTSQVLKIAYLGGTASGGFFPNGLNGTIKVA